MSDIINQFVKERRIMNKIHTEKAPAAVGPYSQAVTVNGMVYTSGQIALDPVTGQLVGTTIEEQAVQVMKNLAAVLEAAGTKPENAVKTLCFLTDMNDFAAFNEVYARYFTNQPARSCAGAQSLPKGALCEVEVIAAV
jgi:2-iminobutanoate/2-iminopropanoate deaminase